MGKYSYETSKLAEAGKDRMRFELGDTMTDGKEETCALCDEEYEAVIGMHKNWKRAKLACLESIFRRFSYEPDTTTGPLSYGFAERAKLWKEEYETLKSEISKSSVSIGAIGIQSSGCRKPPYFYGGMLTMDESEGKRR